MEDDGNRNIHQIIRKDARGCFVEVRNDCFPIGKAHLEFAAYDVTRPAGQRYTNHIHIYIGIPEFFNIAHDVLHGNCHKAMGQRKQFMLEIEEYKKSHNGQLNDDMSKKQTYVNQPLFQMLGGTSADQLRKYGRPRADGMSLSRSVRLSVGSRADYILSAECGAGEADAKGLIVPRYGSKPEQRVAVGMSYASLNEIMLMAQVHYKAWLSSQYANGRITATRQNDSADGNTHVVKNGIDSADDVGIF